MSTRKKVFLIFTLVLLLALLYIIFSPKPRVIGGLRGGPLALGAEAYTEEYQCFGFKRLYCPPWEDYGCDALCYGVRYGKKCFISSYFGQEGSQAKPTACKESTK